MSRHHQLYDPALRYLHGVWKQEQLTAKQPVGFRQWLHDAGVEAPDDIEKFERREVPMSSLDRETRQRLFGEDGVDE